MAPNRRSAADAELAVGRPLVAPALAEGRGVGAVGRRGAAAAVDRRGGAGVGVAPREAAAAGARQVAAVVGVAVVAVAARAVVGAAGVVVAPGRAVRARVEVGAGGAGVAVGRVGAGVRVAPAQALSVGRGGESDENERATPEHSRWQLQIHKEGGRSRFGMAGASECDHPSS